MRKTAHRREIRATAAWFDVLSAGPGTLALATKCVDAPVSMLRRGVNETTTNRFVGGVIRAETT
jgi:hypothetical protein